MSTQIQSIENEPELIEACKRGDHRAFEQLYVKYKERIYSLSYYMSGDRETAKDLTQQIFKTGLRSGSGHTSGRRQTLLVREQEWQRNQRIAITNGKAVQPGRFCQF